MGWNTWNTFGCNINETLIRQMADAIVSNGMRDLGYQYVVVDDCWFNPNRDSAGNLQGDPRRFPSGMQALGDYLHARGLKFGIYQVPAGPDLRAVLQRLPRRDRQPRATRRRTPGSSPPGASTTSSTTGARPTGTINDQVAAFARMRDALAATGRPIVYSINPNSIHEKTGPLRNWGDVANMWRTTEDITNAWDTGQTNGYPMGIQNIVNVTVPLAVVRRARAGSTTRT